jgi:subtilase family serine protease
MRITKLLLLALFVASFSFSRSYAATPDRIAGALNGGSMVTLRGNVHRKALPQFERGPADPGLRFGTMTLLTVPTASQRKALMQLVAEQQDRKSPNYHKWLTPEQWADRFGLSQNDVQKLTDWLKSQGFSIVNVARGRNWITFSGTAAQVQSAFGTEIHRYSVNGEMHVANATAPKIPAALAGVVTGIHGLDDFYLEPKGVTASPEYFNGNFAQPDFLAPDDIATIYDISALYSAGIDGTGQKLAVIGQTDIDLSDLTNFRTGFGLSSISCTTNSDLITACSDPHLQYVLVQGATDPGQTRIQDLALADQEIEWAGAVARNAQIIYVNAPAVVSNGNLSGGVHMAWYDAIDNNRAPVISMSYARCEFFENAILDSTGQPAADELELIKANSMGITFVGYTGDSAASGCDNSFTTAPGNQAKNGYAVGYPASSPEVTAVGGTAIPVANLNNPTYWGSNGLNGGSAKQYIPETAYNDDDEWASFCAANPTNLFCTQGGNTAQTGWVPITSAATAQADIGISSGGGGPSNCAQQTPGFSACVAGFAQPSWQKVTISGQASARFLPDVAMLASHSFPSYIFCTQLSELGDSGNGSSCAGGIANALGLAFPSVTGGTAVSTPVFAGIVTLLNQSLASSKGLGNINPMLYTLAAATPSNGAFHPITTGDNNVACVVRGAEQGAPPCPASGVLGFSASNADASTGYNLVTGLGSVDADKLALAFAAASNLSFTLSNNVANGTLDVLQGQTSTPVNLTVTSTTGFVVTTGGNSSTLQPLTYSCSGLPAESMCNFSPSITSSLTVVSVTISTTPTTFGRRRSDRGARILYAVLLPAFFGIVFTAGSRRRSVRAIRMLGLVMVLGFSTLWLSSCAGSSTTTSPGTKRGSYPIVVNATTGGTNPISASTNFTLTVN